MQKIPFQRGSIVPPSYLNEIQKSIKFTASGRENFYAEPTAQESASWEIGARDRIKDWEIDPQSVLGRHAYSGIVLGFSGPIVVYGPPATTKYLPLRDIETQEFVGLDSQAMHSVGLRGIVIESGSMVSPTGEAWGWPREYFTINLNQTLYAIYHGIEQQLMLVAEIPSRSLPFCLLSKIDIDAQGILTVTDLRPTTHLDNLFTYRQALTNTEIISQNYELLPWQRANVDTRNGSVIIQLPASATDGDEIAVIDLYKSFGANPVIIRPAAGTGLLQTSIEDYVAADAGAVIELYYYAPLDSWQFKSGVRYEPPKAMGEFIQCGGIIEGPVTAQQACIEGALPIDPRYDISIGSNIYSTLTSKCNKLIDATTAVYAGGTYEPFALKCGATKAQLKSYLNS